MSADGLDAVTESVGRVRDRVAGRTRTDGAAGFRTRLLHVLFGDRVGLTLFLGALVCYGLFWRVDVFIVDTFAVVNTLANLEGGRLALETMPYGPSHGRMPGVRFAGDSIVGRNYGHVFLALPILWALRASAVVADPRLVVVGAWALAVFGFVALLGRSVGRDRPGRLGGAVLALGLFVANVAVATDLPSRALPLAALQLTTMLAAAGTGVVVYRLVGEFAGIRAATVAGVATLLAGPVGFWAVVPKRHALVTLLAAVALFAFYRSRAAPERDVEYRSLAYAAVGFTAWVSAHDALVLFVALLSVDALTADPREYRAHALVAGVFLVSLVPFFLTNALATGNPVVPPRMLPGYSGQELVGGGGLGDPSGTAGGGAVSGGTGGTTGGSTGGTAGGTTGDAAGGVLGAVLAVVDRTMAALDRFTGMLADGLAAVLDPTTLYHTFLRSGRMPGVNYSMTGGETVDLAFLEAAPVLGALAALPALALRRLPTRAALRRPLPTLRRALGSLRTDPLRATDLFAATYAVLLCLLYLPRLPLHSTITVRYLAALVPVLVYALARSQQVVRAFEADTRLLVAAACATTLAGLVLAVTVVGPLGRSAGQLVQLHAVLNLALAAVLAGSVLGDSRLPDSVAPVAVGVVLGAMALFVLLSGVEYFGVGRQFALPLADWLATALPLR